MALLTVGVALPAAYVGVTAHETAALVERGWPEVLGRNAFLFYGLLTAVAHALLGLWFARRSASHRIAWLGGLCGVVACLGYIAGCALFWLRVEGPDAIAAWLPHLKWLLYISFAVLLGAAYGVCGYVLSGRGPLMIGLWPGKVGIAAGIVYSLNAALQAVSIWPVSSPARRAEAFFYVLYGLAIGGLMLAVGSQLTETRAREDILARADSPLSEQRPS